MSRKSRNPAIGCGVSQVRIGLAADRRGGALQDDYCTKITSNLYWSCELTWVRIEAFRTLGLNAPLYVLPFHFMQFRARKRKPTSGLWLQYRESSSSSGPQPFRGCTPMGEVDAGSLYRRSKERVRAGLGSVEQEVFLSRVLARALEYLVLTNLPPSSNPLKQPCLRFGMESPVGQRRAGRIEGFRVSAAAKHSYKQAKVLKDQAHAGSRKAFLGGPGGVENYWKSCGGCLGDAWSILVAP